MKKAFLLSLYILLFLVQADAQVTFSEHIAPIIYDNCTSCHRPGEIGPFSLTNYEEVAAWSGMIQYVTEIKYMPPWKPDSDYSNFVGEKGLTDTEIQMIADWVAAGSPQGNPDLEPPLPAFPSGSQLGTPDLVLEMEEVYFIEGNNLDDYRVFVLPTGLTENKEIAAVEFRPGNTKAVHHALVAYEINGEAAALDAQDPGYGYEAFGGFGVPVQGNFTGYTPGIEAVFYPEGIGTTLPVGADILLQVHYAPLPTDETDQSYLNIFFKEPNDPIVREVQRSPGTPFDLDDGWLSFFIPPDEVKTFHGTKEVEEDISLISVYPHSHYLGKDWELYAVTPEEDTVNIIHIPEWDFNWQSSYTFDRMKKVPAGSTIHIYASYDNTTNNPYNPNFPPEMVTWGEGTADEMYLVGLTFVPYLPGDEDIIIGETMPTNVVDRSRATDNLLFSPFPNPGNDEIAIGFYLEKAQDIQMDLFDAKGSRIQNIFSNKGYQAGNHTITFDVSGIAEGIYTIRMANSGMVMSRQLIISR